MTFVGHCIAIFLGGGFRKKVVEDLNVDFDDYKWNIFLIDLNVFRMIFIIFPDLRLIMT